MSFYDPIVLRALKQSNFILAANSESQSELNKRGFNPILLNETGVDNYYEFRLTDTIGGQLGQPAFIEYAKIFKYFTRFEHQAEIILHTRG